MSRDEKWDKHPSYGHVQFSRVSIGGGLNRKHRLFGSAIDNHGTTVMLRVVEAERTHRHGTDWTHGTGTMLVEAELSAAQFAELLTTMNVGTGVPCTIRFRQDTGITPDPPDLETEVDRSRETFKARMVGVGATIRPHLEKIAALTERLPNKTRIEVEREIGQVLQEIERNLPFFAEQFRETTEQVTVAAKAEIEAFTTHAVMLAGVRALTAPEEEQPQIVASIEEMPR